MLEELLAHEGVTEEVVVDAQVGVMALHGGIESGTAAMAREIASTVGASLYVVEVPDDLWWHVPSTRFDPSASDGLGRFIDHVDRVVSLHGFGRPDVRETVLLGGANREMAGRFASTVRAHAACRVVDDLGDIPKKLRGVHPKNPVNLPPSAGVQVEMTEDLRSGGLASSLVRALSAAIIAEMAAL